MVIVWALKHILRRNIYRDKSGSFGPIPVRSGCFRSFWPDFHGESFGPVGEGRLGLFSCVGHFSRILG